MLSPIFTPPGAPAGRGSALRLNWGLLVLFVLFSSVLGVREAQAQTVDWAFLGSCMGTCSKAVPFNWGSTPGCGGCIITIGGAFRDWFWNGGAPAGYGCAKAGIGC